jgi:hypothetical protein
MTKRKIWYKVRGEYRSGKAVFLLEWGREWW